MKSGFSIEWTDYALQELSATFQYLENNFTEREMKNLAVELDTVLKLIANNPKTFQSTDVPNMRKVIVKECNTLFYRVKNDQIVEILSFFSNRQNPIKSKY